METIIWLLTGVGLTLCGDIFLKKSQLIHHWYLLSGLALYAIGGLFVAVIFKKMDFGSVFLAWEALTVIFALIVAVLYFKESFSLYKALALIFALIALYFSYK